MSVYQFSLPTKSGELQSLKDFEGKVLIIVNTASKCGFTHQYEALEALYSNIRSKAQKLSPFLPINLEKKNLVQIAKFNRFVN